MATLFLAVASSASLAGGSDLEDIVRDLQSPEGQTRRDAWRKAGALEPSAVPALADLFDSDNRDVSLAAGHALERLSYGRGSATTRFERRVAVEKAFLDLLSEDRRSTALKTHILDLLGTIGSATSAPRIVTLLTVPDLQAPARRALEHIPGEAVTHAVIAVLASADEQLARDLLITLRERRDPVAFDALLRLAADPRRPRVLRAGAAHALATLGRPEAARVIWKLGEEIGEGTGNDLVADVLTLAHVSQKTHPEEARQIFRLVHDKALGEVHRYAALYALCSTPSEEDLPRLIASLADASPRVRLLALDILGRLASPQTDELLLESFETSDGSRKAAILRVLARRGHAAAARLVQQSTSATDLEVRLTALDLSGELGDPEHEPLLVEAAGTGSPRLRELALGHVLDLADHYAAAAPEHAAKLYDLARRNAQSASLEGRALVGLSRLAAPGVLKEVEAASERRELARYVTRARFAYARALAEKGGRDEAVSLLKEILRSATARADTEEASRVLRELGVDPTVAQKTRGIVPTWWVTGHFPNQNGEAWTASYFPEERIELERTQTQKIGDRDRRFAWRRHTSTHPDGIVDLAKVFRRNENVCAYAYAEVESGREREVLLKIGSDDGIVVWLNGKKVHERNVVRTVTTDEDTARGRLRSGKNTILVKVLQGGGEWGFVVRLVDAATGNALDLTQLDR